MYGFYKSIGIYLWISLFCKPTDFSKILDLESIYVVKLTHQNKTSAAIYSNLPIKSHVCSETLKFKCTDYSLSIISSHFNKVYIISYKSTFSDYLQKRQSAHTLVTLTIEQSSDVYQIPIYIDLYILNNRTDFKKKHRLLIFERTKIIKHEIHGHTDMPQLNLTSKVQYQTCISPINVYNESYLFYCGKVIVKNLIVTLQHTLITANTVQLYWRTVGDIRVSGFVVKVLSKNYCRLIFINMFADVSSKEHKCNSITVLKWNYLKILEIENLQPSTSVNVSVKPIISNKSFEASWLNFTTKSFDDKFASCFADCYEKGVYNGIRMVNQYGETCIKWTKDLKYENNGISNRCVLPNRDKKSDMPDVQPVCLRGNNEKSKCNIPSCQNSYKTTSCVGIKSFRHLFYTISGTWSKPIFTNEHIIGYMVLVYDSSGTCLVAAIHGHILLSNFTNNNTNLYSGCLRIFQKSYVTFTYEFKGVNMFESFNVFIIPVTKTYKMGFIRNTQHRLGIVNALIIFSLCLPVFIMTMILIICIRIIHNQSYLEDLDQRRFNTQRDTYIERRLSQLELSKRISIQRSASLSRELSLQKISSRSKGVRLSIQRPSKQSIRKSSRFANYANALSSKSTLQSIESTHVFERDKRLSFKKRIGEELSIGSITGVSIDAKLSKPGSIEYGANFMSNLYRKESTPLAEREKSFSFKKRMEDDNKEVLSRSLSGISSETKTDGTKLNLVDDSPKTSMTTTKTDASKANLTNTSVLTGNTAKTDTSKLSLLNTNRASVNSGKTVSDKSRPKRMNKKTAILLITDSKRFIKIEKTPRSQH